PRIPHLPPRSKRRVAAHEGPSQRGSGSIRTLSGLASASQRQGQVLRREAEIPLAPPRNSQAAAGCTVATAVPLFLPLSTLSTRDSRIPVLRSRPRAHTLVKTNLSSDTSTCMIWPAW